MQISPAAGLINTRERILNLVFPPHCVVCGQPGTLLCDDCLDSFPHLPAAICWRCGRPHQRPGISQICESCQRRPPTIDGIRAVCYLQANAQKAVHQFKYQNRPGLARPLAGLMVDYWRVHSLPVEVVVAVPLHRARERQRGYNQAYLLARAFAEETGLPFVSGELVRQRSTRAQVGLNAAERLSNVQGAFGCRSNGKKSAITNKQVLVIDDVCTTGATLEACSSALINAEARSVWGFTLARAA